MNVDKNKTITCTKDQSLFLIAKNIKFIYELADRHFPAYIDKSCCYSALEIREKLLCIVKDLYSIAQYLSMEENLKDENNEKIN